MTPPAVMVRCTSCEYTGTMPVGNVLVYVVATTTALWPLLEFVCPACDCDNGQEITHREATTLVDLGARLDSNTLANLPVTA